MSKSTKLSKDQAGSIGRRFLLHEPFDGLHKDYRNFLDEIRTAVASLKHSDSLEFLFPNAWYQRDLNPGPNFNTLMVPIKYRKLENVPVLFGVNQVPQLDAAGNQRFNAAGNPMMRNVTADDRVDAMNHNKYVDKFNQRLTDLNADCLSEVTRRVSPSINLALNKLSGNVLEVMDFL